MKKKTLNRPLPGKLKAVIQTAVKKELEVKNDSQLLNIRNELIPNERKIQSSSLFFIIKVMEFTSMLITLINKSDTDFSKVLFAAVIVLLARLKDVLRQRANK